MSDDVRDTEPLGASQIDGIVFEGSELISTEFFVLSQSDEGVSPQSFD